MSNTNISDIAIKLSVNADGVSKGFRTAAEEARSYKAELDRLVYAVGKNDPVDYNAHVQQFMQVTNERLAREKKAQEEFNAWYNKEMDREVAMFIAAETQKEQATQARIAAERQAALYTHNMQQIVQARPLPAESESRGVELRNLEEAIRRRYALLDQEQQLIQNQVAMNTRNAQRFQATLEMETTARAQANAQLQAAITARYALLDTEERALRDNAANAAAADARKVAAAEQIRQQELANLRTYIQQKYALLDQEERAVRDNATNAAAAQARTSAQTEQSHQQDLANLRTYIQQKYALLDQEERAIRDNAANLAAAQALAVRNAQQTHEQDLQNLREYITQKYAILNREEAIEKMNASNAAEIARLRNMRARQAADAANAQRDADFAAYKADLARQEAEGMISAERRQRIERARQRDAKRAADDDRVRQLNDWRMQQALMQRAAVDTQLTVARMNGGFGGAAMAIGQASYAAEDFIQVLSMGGGLNMALMSASNNLSMVARALLGTSTTMSAVAGIGIPAILIGLGLLTRYLMSTEDTADAVTKSLERFRKETENIGEMTRLNQQAAAEARNIQEMTDSISVEKKIAALKQEQLDLDQKMVQEDVKRTAQNQIIFDSMLGGQSAILDFQNQLNKSMTQGSVGQRNAAAAYSRLLAEARESAIAGNEQSMFASLRKLHDLMTRADLTQPGIRGVDVGFMDNFKALFNDTALLDNLQGLFNPNITNLQENMEAQQKIADELLSQQEHMTEERKRQLTIAKNLLEAQEKHIELFQKEKQLRQDSTLFQLQATEAQKVEMSIRKQLIEYLGLTGTQPGQFDPSLLMGQSRQEAMDFLQAYNASLERSKQEILDEQRQISPTGGMEQSAFKAQAEALQQMLEAQYKKEDPQLKDIDTHIQQGNQLLQQLTDGQGLIRVP